VRFVEEVAVEEFLPTFRSMLAEGLRERGLTQQEVAELLGISQSAVSKYAHGGIERNDAVADSEPVRELVAELSDGLASGELTQVGALVEAEVLIRQLERGGLLAELHEAAMPELREFEGEFAVHDPEGELRAAQRVLASVRRGLRVLEHADGFAGLIPAVGSNLAECRPDAAGIEDVAAVPGRLVAIKGRATVPADPEFGASDHVAAVLLAARAAGSDARAACNVRYSAALVERLEREGYTTAEFEPDADLGGDTEAAVAAAFADGPADVLYQTGGFGVEPIAYVLGPDAPAVARTVRTLARQ